MNLNEHGPKVRVTPEYIVQFAAGAAKTGVHDGVALKKMRKLSTNDHPLLPRLLVMR